jgi:rhamnulokinase
MGLWVLSESVRAWQAAGAPGTDLPTLLARAADHPGGTVVDIDDRSLLPVGTASEPMPARVVALARATGQHLDGHPVAVTRCILDSLALAYRRHVRTAARLSGRDVEVIHVVGGGSRNELLCQLTADACGLPVLAGPAEAAALGNVLVQARTLGADLPDLAAMRALIRNSHPLKRYEPRPGLDWDCAESEVRR